VDTILAAVDITANSTDPLFNFQVSQADQQPDRQDPRLRNRGAALLRRHRHSVCRGPIRWCAATSTSTTAPPGEDQFALLGLSDTANATLIYDKNGISARVAYNWRDRFLQATNRGGARNPVYVEPFGQLDFSISYDVTESLAVSLEGINLTKESLRTYGRDPNQLWFAQELDQPLPARRSLPLLDKKPAGEGEGRCSQRPFSSKQRRIGREAARRERRA
jgi:hypothetical protein